MPVEEAFELDMLVSAVVEQLSEHIITEELAVRELRFMGLSPEEIDKIIARAKDMMWRPI